jgi:hypothetical protein
MEILQLPWSCRCPLVNTPHLNSQVNCSVSCLQDNSSVRTTQKTQPLCCCRGVFTAPLHSNYRGADYIENTVLLLLRTCMLRALRINDRCLPSQWFAAGLYATVFFSSTLYNYLIQINYKFTLIVMIFASRPTYFFSIRYFFVTRIPLQCDASTNMLGLYEW